MGLDQIHPFERAGFGHAPFRCTGSTETRHCPAPGVVLCGTSCDYCGTGIMTAFHVKSSDGISFKVGSDCIRKVFKSFDAEIPKDFREEFARIEREQRDARREVRWNKIAARAAVARQTLEDHTWLFCSEPHPNAYFAGQGRTYRDYLEFLLTSGGMSGRTAACKIIEAEDAKHEAA